MQVVPTHRGCPHSSKCRSLQRETGQVSACRKAEQQTFSKSSPKQVNPLPSASIFFHQAESNREAYIFQLPRQNQGSTYIPREESELLGSCSEQTPVQTESFSPLQSGQVYL